MKIFSLVVVLFVAVILVSGFQDETVIPVIEAESELALGLSIYDLSWHPDGELLAVATVEGIQIFDVNLQLVDEILPPDEGFFQTVGWSPEGDQLAAGGLSAAESIIYVWDYAVEIFTLHTDFTVAIFPEAEQAEGIARLAWSPDGSKLAAQNHVYVFARGEVMGFTYVWDTTTWELSNDRSGRISEPTDALAWNPESTMLATSGYRIVYGYSFDDFSGWGISGLIDIEGIAWSSTNLVSMTSGYGGFYIVDGFTGDISYIFESPYSLPTRTAWSPDGRYLVIRNNGMTSLLDVTIGEVVRILNNPDGVLRVDWTRDGERIAVGTYGGDLEIWNVFDLPDEPSILPTLTTRPTLTPSMTATRFMSATPTPTRTPTLTPTLTPVINHVAFVDNAEISVAEIDGESYSTMQEGDAPTWSYSGHQIVYSRDSQLYIMNTDGTDARPLTDGTFSADDPVWSFDGEWIAFTTDMGGSSGIAIIPAMGGEPVLLIDTPSAETMPDWSPLGLSIAYVSDEDGDDEIFVANLLYVDDEIQVISTDRLTDNTVYDRYPSWSSDGTRMVYVSQDEDLTENVFMMGSDGQLHYMFHRLPLSPYEFVSYRWLDWSPPGHRIVFEGITADGQSNIYSMEPNGVDLVQLTTSGTSGNPEWSPNRIYVPFPTITPYRRVVTHIPTRVPTNTPTPSGGG